MSTSGRAVELGDGRAVELGDGVGIELGDGVGKDVRNGVSGVHVRTTEPGRDAGKLSTRWSATTTDRAAVSRATAA